MSCQTCGRYDCLSKEFVAAPKEEKIYEKNVQDFQEALSELKDIFTKGLTLIHEALAKENFFEEWMEHLEERPIHPFANQPIIDEFLEDLMEPISLSLLEKVVECEDIPLTDITMDHLGSHVCFEHPS